MKLPDGLRKNDSLFIPYAMMAYRASVGGEVRAGFGDPGIPARDSFPGLRWQIVPLSKKDAGRHLCVSIYSDYSYAGLTRRVFLGTPRAHYLRMLRADLPSLVLGALYLLFSTVSLAVFLTRNRQAIYLSFGAFSFCLALYTILHTEVLQLYSDLPAFWTCAWLVCVLVLPLGALPFYREIAGATYRRLLNSIIGIFVLAAAAGAAILVFRPFNPLHIRFPLYTLYLGAMAVLFIIFVREAMRKSTDARIVLFGFTAITLSALWDTFYALTGMTPALGSLVYMGTFLFMVSMAAILIRRNNRAYRELEIFQAKMKELKMAREIQRSILPSDDPRVRGLRVRSLYVPMDEIGGDFYDFRAEGKSALGVLIADVSGHGIPAAFISSMVKVGFTTLAEYQRRPAELMKKLNEIMRDKYSDQFITAVYAYVDASRKTMLMANAGHLPVLLLRGGEEPVEHNVRGRLISSLNRDDFACARIPLRSGDRIVLYTDGVVECMNKKNEIFGAERFNRLTAALKDRDPGEFLEEIHLELKRWAGFPPSLNDDITVIVIDVE